MECPTTNMVSHPGRRRGTDSSQIRGQGKEPSLSASGTSHMKIFSAKSIQKDVPLTQVYAVLTLDSCLILRSYFSHC